MLNSCLYKAQVMHNRLEPKQHHFHYKVFMFFIDLDELPLLRKRFFLFSHNRFNAFSFRDKEHLQLPLENPDGTKSCKEHILAFLKQNELSFVNPRIMLLTNLNVLGYNFNPVSFYYVFNGNDEVECVVAEVSNTFGEMKPYLLGPQTKVDKGFQFTTKKYFYVSPFIDHDASFDFKLQVPGEKLNIRIDDLKNDKRFFISTLIGEKREITNLRLMGYTFRFPLLTLRIISLIHWNALRLWWKKIPYLKKSEHPNLQRGVFRKYE